MVGFPCCPLLAIHHAFKNQVMTKFVPSAPLCRCSSCAAGFSTKRKAGKVTKCSPCDPDSSKAAQMAVYGAIALAFVLARLQK